MLLLRLLIIIFFFFFFIFPISYSIPFIVIHGIGNQCSFPNVELLTEKLITYSGVQGFCIEVGNGAWDSFFMPMQEQADVVCQKVKEMEELKGGYNIVGFSQITNSTCTAVHMIFAPFGADFEVGNLIGRGVVEFCEGGPSVKNFISFAGPHAGTASVPLCGTDVFCKLADDLIKGEVYSTHIQEHSALSGYLKLPNAIPKYLESCRFLPKLNNEKPGQKNSTYKERFSSLENLVLIMFEQDTTLIPKETSWFGYYPDGFFEPILPPQETKLYTEDWIGLRALDEAGRVHFISIPGIHLQIFEADIKKHVVPYLNGQAS